jgi:hypothetical protein
MMVAVVVAVFGLAAWAMVPAIGQDKPAESGALDPRLKSLVGTWEGRVELKMSRDEQGRVLVIQERAGQLEGRFGLPGKGLERVVLSSEVDGGRPKISFKNSAGNFYSLELVKDDWLTGKMTLTGGTRGSTSPDRPVQLERKK